MKMNLLLAKGLKYMFWRPRTRPFFWSLPQKKQKELVHFLRSWSAVVEPDNRLRNSVTCSAAGTTAFPQTVLAFARLSVRRTAEPGSRKGTKKTQATLAVPRDTSNKEVSAFPAGARQDNQSVCAERASELDGGKKATDEEQTP